MRKAPATTASQTQDPRPSAQPPSRIVQLFGRHFGPARPPPAPCTPRTATTRIQWGVWHLLLLLLLPAAVRAQFSYTTKNGTITITGGCTVGDAIIPSMINGLPVTTIGGRAFYGCTSMTSITIPGSVTHIGGDSYSGLSAGSAFYGCTRLTAINVDPANPEYSSIDGVLFSKSRNSLIQCPGTKTGNYAVPSSVTSIQERGFFGCASLTSIRIPSSVEYIGGIEFLFSSGGGEGSTGFYGSGFEGCSDLTAINVDAANTRYSSVDGVLFKKGNERLMLCPAGRAGDYTIPSSVESVGPYPFRGCTRLTSVTFLRNLSMLGGVFRDCTGLTEFRMGEGIFNSTVVDGVLFSGGDLIQYPRGRTGNYTIPNWVSTIGDLAFYGCTRLTSITIPNSVTSIGGYAFSDCTSLTSVTIPNSVTRIWYFAFSGCTRLGGVNFLGNAPGLSPDAFSGATPSTVYYLPGATGWGATFGNRPAVLWNLLIQTGDAHFGAKAGAFGFNVTGTSGLSFVVEAAWDLAQPVWFLVGWDTLIAGTAYFSDPAWVDFPSRVYRIRPQ